MITKEQLDGFYREAEVRTAVIVCDIDRRISADYEIGFYSGHYSKNEQGEYMRECYPIPVISVRNLCDVEVEYDCVSVSAKLNREQALAFDYGVLKEYKFEAYGVEDYLSNFYVDCDFDGLKNNIARSDAAEIVFQFVFDKNVKGAVIAELIVLLQNNGFYY